MKRNKNVQFLICLIVSIFYYSAIGQMVQVSRWVSPITNDFTSIPANKGTDSQILSWGYTNKIFQYEGYLVRPSGNNVTAVNRWIIPNCKEFIIIAEHEHTDQQLISWGYSGKEFLFYAFKSRPNTGNFIAVNRWVNVRPLGDNCRDFTLSVTEVELQDIQLTSWGYTNKMTQFYVPRSPVNAPATNESLRMTNFSPALHGFKFLNDFISNFAGIDFHGLCGGMVYSALDYFNNNNPIPTQTLPPQLGTSLRQYLYDRQQNSTLDNLDKWAELTVNPFGWRTGEFFNWGLQGFSGGRLQELREEIDNGRPVPLGLYKGGNGGFNTHHQVLAIGYDLGRYTGNLLQYKDELKIFVYDPNFPSRTMTLIPNVNNATYYYAEAPSCSWLTYFVDKKYRLASPPR